MFATRPLLALTAAVLAATAGCQKPPSVAVSAKPSAAKAVSPMGSDTSNLEMDRLIGVLGELLDGKVPAEEIAAAHKTAEALKTRQKAGDSAPELSDADRRALLIHQLVDGLPPEVRPGSRLPDGLRREMVIATTYFEKRRFVEAALRLSPILDKDPVHPGARNLLARCFFFLGNPDRAIAELEYILTQQAANPEEVLDALFLTGAMITELPAPTPDQLEKAKAAWTRYLKVAPNSTMRTRVEAGLKDIQAGIDGKGKLAGKPMAAPSGPGSGGGPAQASRVAALGKDASPLERAVAEAVDAFVANDLVKAEAKLDEALALNAAHTEALTMRGRVYVKTGRIPDAIKAFDAAIAADKGYMPAWHYKGMAHLMGRDPAAAAKSWRHIEATDAAYFNKFGLARRVQVAERMAGQ